MQRRYLVAPSIIGGIALIIGGVVGLFFVFEHVIVALLKVFAAFLEVGLALEKEGDKIWLVIPLVLVIWGGWGLASMDSRKRKELIVKADHIIKTGIYSEKEAQATIVALERWNDSQTQYRIVAIRNALEERTKAI